MAGSTAATRRTSQRTSWFTRIALGVLGFLMVLLVFFVATVWMGRVEGEEFDPAGFQRRTFRYYEIPLLHLQVSPIRRKTTTGTLEQRIVAKYATPANRLTVSSQSASGGSDEDSPAGSTPAASPGSSTDWHLVSGRRGGSIIHETDATILINYLDAEDEDSKPFWLGWSDANGDLAKVLWPAVAELAEARLYILVPDLFELARAAEDPDAFRSAVRQQIASSLLQLARQTRELNDLPEARRLVRLGMQFAPHEAELQRLNSELATGSQP